MQLLLHDEPHPLCLIEATAWTSIMGRSLAPSIHRTPRIVWLVISSTMAGKSAPVGLPAGSPGLSFPERVPVQPHLTAWTGATLPDSHDSIKRQSTALDREGVKTQRDRTTILPFRSKQIVRLRSSLANSTNWGTPCLIQISPRLASVAHAFIKAPSVNARRGCSYVLANICPCGFHLSV